MKKEIERKKLKLNKTSIAVLTKNNLAVIQAGQGIRQTDSNACSDNNIDCTSRQPTTTGTK